MQSISMKHRLTERRIAVQNRHRVHCSAPIRSTSLRNALIQAATAVADDLAQSVMVEICIRKRCGN